MINYGATSIDFYLIIVELAIWVYYVERIFFSRKSDDLTLIILTEPPCPPLL